MLPKQFRLTRGEDFTAVYSKGTYASLDGISVKYAQNSGQGLRIGFSVGKNYSKLAVERNRLRRLLREGAGQLLPTTKTDLDIIIMPCGKKRTLSTTEAFGILEKLFTKAKLFK